MSAAIEAVANVFIHAGVATAADLVVPVAPDVAEAVAGAATEGVAAELTAENKPMDWTAAWNAGPAKPPVAAAENDSAGLPASKTERPGPVAPAAPSALEFMPASNDWGLIDIVMNSSLRSPLDADPISQTCDHPASKPVRRGFSRLLQF
jgi:hypothetical protein